jgi:hypothetical protein
MKAATQTNNRPQPSERLAWSPGELDELSAVGCDTVREETMPPAPIVPGAGQVALGRRAGGRQRGCRRLRL